MRNIVSSIVRFALMLLILGQFPGCGNIAAQEAAARYQQQAREANMSPKEKQCRYQAALATAGMGGLGDIEGNIRAQQKQEELVRQCMSM